MILSIITNKKRSTLFLFYPLKVTFRICSSVSHYPTTFRPREVFPYDEFAELPDLFFGLENWQGEERIANYEVETNTLLLRPLYPLRECLEVANRQSTQ